MDNEVLFLVLVGWVAVLILLGAAAIVVSVRLVIVAMRMVRNAKLQVKKIDTATKNKFNKIATLTVSELDDYLTRVYVGQLEIAVMKDVSPRDPNNAVVLFAKSLEYMHVYIGEETIAALDYYYGVGYMDRWCKFRYQLLESSGQLSELVNKHHNRLSVAEQ